MKKLLLTLFLIAGQLCAQTSMRINQLPVKNTPDGTDSIPAEDTNNVTWRIPFSKFGAGGGGGSLPDMTGNANKILTNNGTVASWTPTPTITLSNATGLPVSGLAGAGVGLGNLGTSFGAFMTAPTSAAFALTLTDENGTGKVIFSAGTLAIASGKTLTASNTITLSAANDSSSLNIGTGGTLGTAAFTASSAYLTSTGSASNLTVLATGFDGNLTPSDDTVQEVAQKLDDLVAGAGTLPSMTGKANQILTNNGTVASWTAAPTISLANATLLPVAGINASANVLSFLGATNYAGMRTQLAASIGTFSDLLPKPVVAGDGSKFLRDDNTWQAVGGGTAASVSYSNTTSGLAATNVQTAIDVVNDKFAGVTANSVVGLRKSAGASTTDSAATPNVDYAVTSIGTIAGGTTGSRTAWPTGKTEAREATSPMTVTVYGTLPPASSYAPGTVIRYLDAITDAAVGRVFGRNGTNTINGGTADVTTFVAGHTGTNGNKASYFVTDGVSDWRQLNPGSVDYVQDVASLNKLFFDTSTNLSGNSTMVVPNGSFTGVSLPSNGTLGNFVTGIGSTGVLSAGAVPDWSITRIEYVVSPTANDSVTTGGQVTSVKIEGALSGSRTYTWPPADDYPTGRPVRFYDSSGSLSSTKVVTVNASGTDTFRGSSSFTITQPYFSIVLTPNASDNTWAIAGLENASIAVMPFTTISGTSLPINEVPTASELNYRTTLTGNTTLALSPSIPNGKKINLYVQQPATGGVYNYTLLMPAGQVQTQTNGLGILAIATGANAVTRVELQKTGTVYQATANLDMTASVVSGGTTPVVDTENGIFASGGGAADINVGQGNSNPAKNVSGQFLALSTRTVTKVSLPLQLVGDPASILGTRSVGIYADAARYTFSDATVSNGSNTVLVTTSTFAQNDLGQRITGTGIPDPSYIGTVATDGKSCTLSTTPGANNSINATGAGTSVTVFGVPASTPIGTVSADVTASAITGSYTVYTDFTGISATVTAGNMYHVVLRSSVAVGTFDAANYINWAGKSFQRITGHICINIASPSWSQLGNGKTPWFQLWHNE